MSAGWDVVYPLNGEEPMEYLKRQLAIARATNHKLSNTFECSRTLERAICAEKSLKDAKIALDALESTNHEQTRQMHSQQQVISGKSKIINDMAREKTLAPGPKELMELIPQLRKLLEEQRELLSKQDVTLREGKEIIDELRREAANSHTEQIKAIERIKQLEKVIGDQGTALADKMRIINGLTKEAAGPPRAPAPPLQDPAVRQMSDLRQTVAVQADRIDKLNTSVMEKDEVLQSAQAKEDRLSTKIKELKEQTVKVKDAESRSRDTIQTLRIEVC